MTNKKLIPLDEYASINVGTIVYDSIGKDYSQCIEIELSKCSGDLYYFFKMIKRESGLIYDWQFPRNILINFRMFGNKEDTRRLWVVVDD